MVLINKYTKLSSHVTSMSINDRLLVKQIMLIGLSSAKFLLYGVNVVYFSNDHKVVSSLKPQLHIHDFGHGKATTLPDLSSRDASA